MIFAFWVILSFWIMRYKYVAKSWLRLSSIYIQFVKVCYSNIYDKAQRSFDFFPLRIFKFYVTLTLELGHALSALFIAFCEEYRFHYLPDVCKIFFCFYSENNQDILRVAYITTPFMKNIFLYEIMLNNMMIKWKID